jgi:hypothetical protein
MEVTMEVLLVLALAITLAVLAVRFGYDSRDGLAGR